MKKITQKQIAGMNLIYSRSTLQDFLNSMNHLGIENIELWSQLQFFCEYYKSTSNTTELKNELKSRNLKLVSFIPEQCTWPYNIASSANTISGILILPTVWEANVFCLLLDGTNGTKTEKMDFSIP